MAREQPDLRKLMQQAQQMQARVQKAQEELAAQTFRATAGGGVVAATVDGAGSVVAVEFDPSVLDPDDPEIVGDLVVAAVNAAFAEARRAAEELMGSGLGDVDLGGLDLGGLLGG